MPSFLALSIYLSLPIYTHLPICLAILQALSHTRAAHRYLPCPSASSRIHPPIQPALHRPQDDDAELLSPGRSTTHAIIAELVTLPTSSTIAPTIGPRGSGARRVCSRDGTLHAADTALGPRPAPGTPGAAVAVVLALLAPPAQSTLRRKGPAPPDAVGCIRWYVEIDLAALCNVARDTHPHRSLHRRRSIQDYG